MAVAQKDLDEYEKILAPKLAEQEKAKAAQTAKFEAELKAFEAKLPQLAEAWEKKQSATVEWIPLRPTSVRASARGAGNDVKLSVLADRSIFASGKEMKGSYMVECLTELRGITAVRLEAMADDRLPGGGPGMAGGNFVLSAFDATATAVADAKQVKKVDFHRPQADFTQENFSIAQAIDGNVNAAQGWAVSPAMGVTHWAVLETKEPIGFEGGTRLTFKLTHQFRGNKVNFALGRFRISVAIAKPPFKLGLSEELQTVLAVPAKERDKAQLALLDKYYRGIDPELRKYQKAVADSKQPLPIDPKLKELREQLELVSRPVPPDGPLVQLREDVKMSTAQLTNRRLTGVQDLAWALINSPAFLFNH